MKKNIGTIDRAIRAIAGIAAIAAYAMGLLAGTAGIVALVAGERVLLGTAVLGWCPPYAIFGLSTCKVKHLLNNAFCWCPCSGTMAFRTCYLVTSL